MLVHLIKLLKKILLLWKLKAEVNKLDIKVLFNVPTGLNNLKTKVDDLDVGILKTVPVDLKKIKWCSSLKHKICLMKLLKT